MIRIVLQSEIADQIRQSEGPIELVDEKGVRLGVVHRPPTDQEIEIARSRIGTKGPKCTVDELIAKVEAL